MDIAEETKCLRTLQEADLSRLQSYLKGGVTTSEEGTTSYAFKVTYGEEQGQLSFSVQDEDGEILQAYMDVNFQTPLGLNRSPLELRILCEHIRDLWPR